MFRSEELHSRIPIAKELKYYQVEKNIAIFLPPLDEDGDAELLPDLLKKHVKNISVLLSNVATAD